MTNACDMALLPSLQLFLPEFWVLMKKEQLKNKFNMFPVDFAYIWAYSHINLKVGVIFIDQSRPDQKQLNDRLV